MDALRKTSHSHQLLPTSQAWQRLQQVSHLKQSSISPYQWCAPPVRCPYATGSCLQHGGRRKPRAVPAEVGSHLCGMQ